MKLAQASEFKLKNAAFMTKTTENRQKILSQALEISGKNGWNAALVEKAAQAAGLPENYGHVAFPGGISELADFYSEECTDKMLKVLTKQKLMKLKIREKIEEGVMARLAIYNEHKAAVRMVVAFYALPQNSLSALKNLSRVCDTIWRLAGDNSTDFNYYTKRLLLGGVYTSTLLFWLNDSSKDMAPTREFLRRRIQNVMEIQKVKGAATAATQKAGKFVEDLLPKLRADR